jgi:hypothetical protein
MFVWIFLFILIFMLEWEDYLVVFILWVLLSAMWIVPIFTGINIKDGSGQYQGYVVAVEQSGAIFKGYIIYLKTDLTSSNEDVACINRENNELIGKLKEAQKNKENIIVEYESMFQYGIGVCPNSGWMVMGFK